LASDSAAASPTKWRPPVVLPVTPTTSAGPTKVAEKTPATPVVAKTVIEASLDAKDAKINAIEAAAKE
jgi:hypothetical protein